MILTEIGLPPARKQKKNATTNAKGIRAQKAVSGSSAQDKDWSAASKVSTKSEEGPPVAPWPPQFATKWEARGQLPVSTKNGYEAESSLQDTSQTLPPEPWFEQVSVKDAKDPQRKLQESIDHLGCGFDLKYNKYALEARIYELLQGQLTRTAVSF